MYKEVHFFLKMKKMKMKSNTYYRRGNCWNAKCVRSKLGKHIYYQKHTDNSSRLSNALHWTQIASKKENVMLPDLSGASAPTLCGGLQTLHLHCCISAVERISVHNQPWHIAFTPHGEIKCISN